MDADDMIGKRQARTTRGTSQHWRRTRPAEVRVDDMMSAAAALFIAKGMKAAEELRAKLLQQYSQVLDTRDTERGLVVNMSDVLFDTGKYTLRQTAREKLARIAGIILNYPGLRLEAEDIPTT